MSQGVFRRPWRGYYSVNVKRVAFTSGGVAPFSVSPGFISATDTVYTPSVQLSVAPSVIATATSVYTPTLSLSVSTSIIASTTSVFTPSIALSLSPSLIASATVVYGPSIRIQVTVASVIASTTSVSTPTASLVASVSPPVIASTSSVFAPSLSIQLSVSPSAIASATSVFAPSTSLSLSPSVIASTTSVFTPSLSLQLSLALISSTTTVYTPTVSVAGQVDLSAPLITSTTDVYAPSVSFNVSVSPAVIASTTSVFAPAEQLQVGPTIIATATAVFTPVVTLSLNVSPTVIASTTSIFTPTVDSGATPPEPETPSIYNPSGGGGPAFRSANYRKELKREIMRAVRRLQEAETPRARKRRAKKISRALVDTFDLEAIPPLLDLTSEENDSIELMNAQANLSRLLLSIHEQHAASKEQARKLLELANEYLAAMEAVEAIDRERELAIERARKERQQKEIKLLLTLVDGLSSVKKKVRPIVPAPAKEEKPIKEKVEAKPKKEIKKIEFIRDENGLITGAKIEG